MRVTRLTLRDFRSYPVAAVELGPGLTVVHGPNGAGKTNLLEALYLACTGRSCRTATDREVIRFGTQVARVELEGDAEDGPHTIAVGLEAGERKRVQVDGHAVERLADEATRPLAAVFLPDRLELVKGAPGLRRAHLDQVVAALWPARADTRRAYGRALAQRNALLARVRAGRSVRDALRPWDAELARHGIAVMGDRRSAADALAEPYVRHATELGLDGDPSLAYRARSAATSAEALAREMHERLDGDLERGFSGHGPHRDELVLSRAGRPLRVYGSQGQQRLALLALLLAEREVIGATRGAPPLMLLDDVMSELDADRRRRLVALLEECDGQSVITTTDLGHVPAPGAARIAVREGGALAEAGAAAA